MATEMGPVELDDGPFDEVLERAFARHGTATVRAMLDADAPCPRRRASGRLFIRRFAAGRPGSGMPGDAPSWSYLDHFHRIDAELARMGVSGAEASGCGRDDCLICQTVACPDCGGATCSPRWGAAGAAAV